MNSPWKILINGIFKENPIFVLLLGMCPTLGVTTSAVNGLGMGLATAFVLMLSNMVIASLKNLIPDTVRIPAFIVIIAAFVTVVDLLMQAYVPDLHARLGLFIPLIVVNCIVLGRAEAFASKNSIVNSLFDGLGMGAGFTVALTVLGLTRELLGGYSAFGYKIINTDGILVFVLAPGAFFALGLLLIIVNAYKNRKKSLHR
jgi:electron transport complex protein RnfE